MMIIGKKQAFSLTEVLMAVGILAVGLVLIAGTFPVGIGLTTVAAERTIGAVAADEAFAKIQLYGIDLSAPNLVTGALIDFNDVANIDSSEFAYPSVDTGSEPSYYWSALCRKIDDDSGRVQVTVFVCRKTGLHSWYPSSDQPVAPVYDWPRPVFARELRVVYSGGVSTNQLIVHPSRIEHRLFFNVGSTVVADQTGNIYRVLDRIIGDDRTIELDREVQLNDITDVVRRATNVWVVPPAVGGGRNPTIGVYQRIIKF